MDSKPNDRIELNDSELEQVNGATFTSNMFTKKEYNKYNIKTEFHFFSKDEFQLPTGEWVDADEADEYIRQVDPDFYNRRWARIMKAID